VTNLFVVEAGRDGVTSLIPNLLLSFISAVLGPAVYQIDAVLSVEVIL
jgi:hypothetical protein